MHCVPKTLCNVLNLRKRPVFYNYFMIVWGLRGKVEGAEGVASVRRHQKLPLCLTESVPADSNADLVLAKAKPISDGGSTSGTTNFRRGEEAG